jgi:hypothetical protein
MILAAIVLALIALMFVTNKKEFMSQSMMGTQKEYCCGV